MIGRTISHYRIIEQLGGGALEITERRLKGEPALRI
jgi:hypothetical protein